MKLSKLLAIGVVTMGLSTAAMAGDGHHPRGERGLLGDKMVSYLALTDEQQSQIKSVFEAQKQSMEKPDHSPREQHEALKALTQTTGSFDEDGARELISAQQNAHMERQIAHLKTQHQVWNLLSTEQQEKLAELKDKKKDRKGRKERKSRD